MLYDAFKTFSDLNLPSCLKYFKTGHLKYAVSFIPDDEFPAQITFVTLLFKAKIP